MKLFLLNPMSHKSDIVNNKERPYTQYAAETLFRTRNEAIFNETISFTCSVPQIIHSK